VIQGILDVPEEKIRAAIASGDHAYVDISVAVKEVLKGDLDDKRITIRFYTRPASGVPDPKAVLGFDGKHALVFVVHNDDPHARGYYFAGQTPLALQAADARAVDPVRREIDKQRLILKTFARNFPPQQGKAHRAVKQLVEAALDAKSQRQAFRELEALGQDAVPAMILLMDDRRPLPERTISLRNPEGHWEAVRHYRPEVVADALDAILNQITGESFGSIAGGGSERERRETINGWRIYLHYLKKEPR
jgi:hypothetical protein